MITRNRILMNEEGGSPGGGSQQPPAPVQPPANNGAAEPPPIPLDAIKSAVGAAFGEFRNGLFADLRKAGVLGKEKSQPSEQPAPDPAKPNGAPSAAAGLSLADVEAMLERERVITARATKHNLNDAQIRRLKAGLSGVPVESFASEADSFLADMGLVRTESNPSPAPAQPAQPQPSNVNPISDRGSPAPAGVLDWEREFAENPIGMSPAARQRMDAKYGPDKARRMRLEAGARQAEQIRVTKPQG